MSVQTCQTCRWAKWSPEGTFEGYTVGKCAKEVILPRCASIKWGCIFPQDKGCKCWEARQEPSAAPGTTKDAEPGQGQGQDYFRSANGAAMPRKTK